MLICLEAVLRGTVHWLERGRYRIGLVMPSSPSGGYAIVEWTADGQKPSPPSVFKVDDLYRDYGPESVWRIIATDPDAHDLAHLVALAVVERDRLAQVAERSTA